MPSEPQPPPALVRAIGRWSLTALVVNSIIGSAVFGLPSVVAALLGRASLLAVPAAGSAIAVVVACYAEVASLFSETGGTYLYARAAFGRFAGIQVGWFTFLGRLTGFSAAANLFVVYLGALWHPATLTVPRFFILTLLIGTIAAVNYRGVRAGAQVSNIFVIAKLLPLAIVCIAGAIFLVTTHRVIPPHTPSASSADWINAILVLFFAYGGFETALIPVGEAKDPRRDAAFALFVALAVVGLLYAGIQWIVLGVLPDPAHGEHPLADVMQILMGRTGATLIALGALISVYGFISALMLSGPRALFALAERGDFPPQFAAIHPRFRTPHVSILAVAILSWLLALFGTFAWNAALSSAARLLYYGLVCAAVPILRRKPRGNGRVSIEPGIQSALRLPGGLVFPIGGMLICAVLLSAIDFSKSLILAATFLIALINWLLVRRTPPAHK